MRRVFVSLAILAGVLGWSLTAPAGALGADDSANKDTEKFQGKWKPTKIEGANPIKVDDLHITIKGDKISLEGVIDKPVELIYKLDESAKPTAIDITFELGTLLGIYEFEGDTLKICYSEMQEGKKGTRPTDLTAAANSKRYLWVLKREK